MQGLQLAAYLAAAHDRHERTRRVLDEILSEIYLFLQQKSRRFMLFVVKFSDRLDRAMRSMADAECIVYVKFAVFSELTG